MISNPELSPIVPLKLPNPGTKKKRTRTALPPPEKFDFDKQRMGKYGDIRMPSVIPYRRGRIGRIIMIETARHE